MDAYGNTKDIPGLPNEEIEEDWICSRGVEISETYGHMCYSKIYPSPIEPESYTKELPLSRRLAQEHDRTYRRRYQEEHHHPYAYIERYEIKPPDEIEYPRSWIAEVPTRTNKILDLNAICAMKINPCEVKTGYETCFRYLMRHAPSKL